MKFGILHNTSVADWRLVPAAEEMGFDSAWFGDSQMIWSDVYAVMALAAHYTTRIKLATGVTIAGARIAPTVASAIGTINQIAPGRVALGVGTGHTAMRTMGFDPMKAGPFRDYVRVLRDLLDGKPTSFTLDGETHEIAHLHPNQGFFDFEHKIPLYVAASGPLACRTAGAYGDGRIGGGEGFAQLAKNTELIRQGAAEAGRSLPDPFPQVFLVTALVVRPGETLSSDRVIDAAGAQVTARLHGWWEAWIKSGSEAFVPDDCRETWDAYKAYLDDLGLSRDALHRHVHRGHCTYLVPEERRFVTPAMIRRTSRLIAPPDEIIDYIRQLETAGVSEISVLCDSGWAREVYADLAEQVIDRY
jgi:alkanesulfonate monooxygenase SsuD/methylene tetrahydromethanopterin reductase-like flavin-dependent oxidoreductase (luciferase family)